MKIGQVAPLYESVPPKCYGGTERVVSYLTEELVREGHDVVLFASADSVTGARLVGSCPKALRLDEGCQDPLVHHVRMIELVAREARALDVIHFHLAYLHFPVARRLDTPHVTTLHGRLDIPELVPLFSEFSSVPVVSISNAQRGPLPWLDWQATVYHGLPRDLYTFRPQAGEYLAFVGRISPEKRVDRSIEIAVRTGERLRIAAKVDQTDRAYFEQVIRPLLAHPLVEYMGEIGDTDKNDFLGHARALLFPVDWPEPFGLAMIEAMACGTPVVAYRRGSVSEVVDEGVTGYIVDGLEDAIEAVEQIDALSRRRCREVFEERFSVERMAQDYVRVYENLLSGETRPERAA